MAGLNNKILKKANDITQDRPRHYVITGPRMIGRLKAEEIEYTMFPGMKEKNVAEIAQQIKDFVIGKVQNKEFGKVIVVYADPVSISTQEIRAIHLLPAHDLYRPELNQKPDAQEVIYQESSVDAIMGYLTEVWITNKLIQHFQDNKMSEYAAQAMQLDGSLQNLEDLQKRLKLSFNKTRREIIDSSLRETVASMLVTG